MAKVGPQDVHFTSYYKSHFAFDTLNERVPAILEDMVVTFIQDEEEITIVYGKDALADLKMVNQRLANLRNEIKSNQRMRPILSKSSDAKYYNDYLRQHAVAGHDTFHSSILVLAECYVYRRIREVFEMTKSLRSYDPFRKQKEEQFYVSSGHITRFAKHVLSLSGSSRNSGDYIKMEFIKLLKVCLWGNKCDLALSMGKVGSYDSDPLESLRQLDSYIICNHSKEIWNIVSDLSDDKSQIVDIVFDNAGYEVFSDLCLADFLITKGLAQSVRFYVKSMPWFVSDVTLHDFHWMLSCLSTSDHDALRSIGIRWSRYLKTKKWVVIEHNFWTLPVEYAHMQTVSPDLYKKLSEAKIVIFKGDLNYRKLFGKKKLQPTSSVDVGLQGFHPTRVVSLRTLKCDIICGLAKGVAERRTAEDQYWNETGCWGVIQCSGVRRSDRA